MRSERTPFKYKGINNLKVKKRKGAILRSGYINIKDFRPRPGIPRDTMPRVSSPSRHNNPKCVPPKQQLHEEKLTELKEKIEKPTVLCRNLNTLLPIIRTRRLKPRKDSKDLNNAINILTSLTFVEHSITNRMHTVFMCFRFDCFCWLFLIVSLSSPMLLLLISDLSFPLGYRFLCGGNCVKFSICL